MKALIAGAGIGGLTSALFLNRAGIEVELFEQSKDLREVGVGINMLPHAVKALASLGLLGALDSSGIRTRELIYLNRFGQIVWREPRGLDAGYDVPQYSIHRGSLLGLLHRATVDRLGAERIHVNRRLTNFTADAAGVVINLVDDTGARFEARGDLLIGADGIHSVVRKCLYPDEGRPIWNGIMLWRGVAEWPTWEDGRTMAIAGRNDAKFVFYPIADLPGRRDGKLTNWAIMARIASHGSTPARREAWSRRGRFDEAIPFVRDRFRLSYVDPEAIIKASGAFYEYPNCDRDPLPRWSFGRVTLLGDAAHPMYPVGSNGASQAILDARCLAEQLASCADLEAGLAAYDLKRRSDTTAIVLANRLGGPERIIDMIEARAPEGFDDIDAVATEAERRAVVRGYASLAGYAQSQVAST